MWALIISIVVALPAGESAEFKAELNQKFLTEATCIEAIPAASAKFKTDFVNGDVPWLEHILKESHQETFEAKVTCTAGGVPA